MNPIKLFDSAILAAADGLVLWSWDTLHIKRIWLLRVFLLLTMLLMAVLEKWIALATLPIILIAEEILNRFLSNDAWNILVTFYRTELPWSIIRPVLFAWCLFDFVEALAKRGQIDAWLEMMFIFYSVVSWTYRPTQPPKKREPKLVLARAKSHG